MYCDCLTVGRQLFGAKGFDADGSHGSATYDGFDDDVGIVSPWFRPQRVTMLLIFLPYPKGGTVR